MSVGLSSWITTFPLVPLTLKSAFIGIGFLSTGRDLALFSFGEAVLDLDLVTDVVPSTDDCELAVFLELEAAIHDFLLVSIASREVLDPGIGSKTSAIDFSEDLLDPSFVFDFTGDREGLLLKDPVEELKLVE